MRTVLSGIVLTMTTIQRVRVAWTGGSGGDGVSTFYADDATTLSADLHTFFTAIATAIPDEITLTIEPGGEELDAGSGDLVGVWSREPLAPIPGGYSGNYAASSGTVMLWLTPDIINSHRVKGKTFLVPGSPASFNGTGGVSAGSVAGVSALGQDLLDSAPGNLKVWHRPVGGSGGVAFSANFARLSDKPAVLRSRRD